MFDRFGEFDSHEEINLAAEGLFNEGDLESLRIMAAENGIPEEMVKTYIAGDAMELCDPLLAALGKIDIECADLKPVEIMEDWVEYLRGRCMESDEICQAVRRKGKTIKGMIGELLKWSFKNAYVVDKDIAKAAGIDRVGVKMGIPGMGRAKKIINEYYLGGGKK